MKVLYLTPKQGGISDFAKTITDICYKYLPDVGFERHSYLEHYLTIAPSIWHFLVLRRSQPKLIWAELGASNRRVFWISYFLARHSSTPFILTLHDPGIIIHGPIALKVLSHLPGRFGQWGKQLANIINAKYGTPRLNWLLKHASKLLVLNKDIVQIRGHTAQHLPHPVYREAMERHRRARKHKILRVGYLGFWGREKGLTTIADSVELIQHSGAEKKYKFIISGGEKNDAFSRKLQTRLSQFPNFVSIKRYIDPNKLYSHLNSLDVMIVPYWPELPGGSSATVQRAVEVGLPILASNTTALRAQLGNDATFFQAKDAKEIVIKLDHIRQNYSRALSLASDAQEKLYKTNAWKKVARVIELHIKDIDL